MKIITYGLFIENMRAGDWLVGQIYGMCNNNNNKIRLNNSILVVCLFSNALKSKSEFKIFLILKVSLSRRLNS